MSRVHMQNGNIAEKGKLLSHAIVIIGGGLQQGLNLEKGGTSRSASTRSTTI